MLEYRGYGFSHGSPSEEGLYMDAQAGIEYLAGRSDINCNEIIVFGRSLGMKFFQSLFNLIFYTIDIKLCK